MALIATIEEMNVGYNRLMPIREFDLETQRLAKNIFEDYKKRGIIINGDFEHMAWTLSNETNNVGLTLFTFEGGAKKTAMSWIGCTYRQYVLCVKSYILFNLGEMSLATLQELTRFFNRLAISDSGEVIKLLEYGIHMVALLQFIPGGNEQRDVVIAELEEKMERKLWNKRKSNQRQLLDFKSYLRFNEVLANFWLGADERQKLFYFPLYFWWNLTAILPLRPMEFLLTPRDCLHSNNGENMLTVRRTKLKGGKGKIGYCVADDYEIHEYTITKQLAEELQQYIKNTESMRMAELDTLLLQKPHFNYFGTKVIATSRYYTYASLNSCRRYFYKEVVAALGDDIAEIRLGDTRHLAMTNLILSGGSPVICRELAGHANINISSHYYTNISNLVECITVERYRKSKGAGATISGNSKYPVIKPSEAIKIDGGMCASPAFVVGDIDDCLKVGGRDANIGDCCYCRYYLPNTPGVMLEFYNNKTAKEQLDADSRYLIRMIELVRKGIGYTEDIGAALLQLQHSGDHYGKCLWEKYSKG